MNQKTTRVSYPVHSGTAGPIETVQVQMESATLESFYLNYALACICEKEVIELRFLPGLKPYQVLVGENLDHLEVWAPTRNSELASQLVKRFSGKELLHPSKEDLAQLVIAKYGTHVVVPMPKYVHPESSGQLAS